MKTLSPAQYKPTGTVTHTCDGCLAVWEADDNDAYSREFAYKNGVRFTRTIFMCPECGRQYWHEPDAPVNHKSFIDNISSYIFGR